MAAVKLASNGRAYRPRRGALLAHTSHQRITDLLLRAASTRATAVSPSLMITDRTSRAPAWLSM